MVSHDEVMAVLRLSLRAALHACDHHESTSQQTAKRGCGACRAVVAIKNLMEHLRLEMLDDRRSLLQQSRRLIR